MNTYQKKIFWIEELATRNNVEHNIADIVIKEMEKKKWLFVDVSIPMDNRVVIKRSEGRNVYGNGNGDEDKPPYEDRHCTSGNRINGNCPLETREIPSKLQIAMEVHRCAQNCRYQWKCTDVIVHWHCKDFEKRSNPLLSGSDLSLLQYKPTDIYFNKKVIIQFIYP